MKKYGLGFISDNDIYEHVKKTVLNYRFDISSSRFRKNKLDPIKLTFDSIVYNQQIEITLNNEINRQLDKSNTNQIGIFHQGIFEYLHNGWSTQKDGYDVVNEEKLIYAEIKNKHNTTNSDSGKQLYERMINTILQKPSAKCFLVEVIAKNSQDISWIIPSDKKPMNYEYIRRISIDKFYKLVTGDPFAFKKLCMMLPTIIKDVISNEKAKEKSINIIEELKDKNPNLLEYIYMSSFGNYEGFNDFHL